jgi:beta-galactosidase/beta-glucuronidase
MNKHIIVVSVLVLVLGGCKQTDKTKWQPVENPIMTRWAADVDPSAPWPEYPRPGLVRSEWKSLNGLWDYAIMEKDLSNPVWQGKILVPYPVESALSGVKKRMTDSLALWYHTIFSVPDKWKGEQLIINFEASDWETTVWVDGQIAGTHRGGYDPFSFNLTSILSKKEMHELLVKVWDPTDKGKQPRGKQVSKPGGIWYTPTTGIWQSVWIEPVGELWINDLRIIPDIDNKTLTVTVLDNHVIQKGEDNSVHFEVSVCNKRDVVAFGKEVDGKDLVINIPDPLLWSPENPFLYDIQVKLFRNDKVIDEVTSYAGMRKISLGKTKDGFTRILLNNTFVWQLGPLDQGFWPDGIYTPPTEEAMKYDIVMLKKMGFNMLRKHVKVESRRYYYLTDHLGMLVWQDMPSGDDYIWDDMPDIKKSTGDSLQFITELKRLIDTKYNNPSIIMWVVYNEGWGQYKTAEVTGIVSAYDTTRLVNSASGWTDRGSGDVMDVHHYPEPVAPPAEENRAIVLGEFGGLGLPVTGHTWESKNWGYRNMTDSLQLLSRYSEFYITVRKLVKEKGLSASIYTQTTDVETETNGLFTYDRAIDKMGFENVRKANLGE